MEILHFKNGEMPTVLDPVEGLAGLPAEGFLWVDFHRDESPDWPEQIRRLVGCTVDAEHVSDSLNADHPSYFDSADDYDMLVFAGLGPTDDAFPLQTRVGSFFMFDRVLVTVRPEDGPSFRRVKQKLARSGTAAPSTIVGLVLLILDAMIDRYLKVRELLDRKLTAMQDELLAPHCAEDDWRALLEGRREARRLEALSETQLETLDAWRRNTRFDWNTAEEIRVRDLCEHIRRVRDHASNAEHDVETAVQLHFASVAHRTNRIMQTLTVLSAIFFPLTLITGIYGMNFDHMPELHTRHGYFVVLALLPSIAIVLLLLFKRRGYF